MDVSTKLEIPGTPDGTTTTEDFKHYTSREYLKKAEESSFAKVHLSSLYLYNIILNLHEPPHKEDSSDNGGIHAILFLGLRIAKGTCFRESPNCTTATENLSNVMRRGIERKGEMKVLTFYKTL